MEETLAGSVIYNFHTWEDYDNFKKKNPNSCVKCRANLEERGAVKRTFWLKAEQKGFINQDPVGKDSPLKGHIFTPIEKEKVTEETLGPDNEWYSCTNCDSPLDFRI